MILNARMDACMVIFVRNTFLPLFRLTLETRDVRPGVQPDVRPDVRPGVRPDVRTSGRRACRQRRRKKNHLIKAAPFGRLDQMIRTTERRRQKKTRRVRPPAKPVKGRVWGGEAPPAKIREVWGAAPPSQNQKNPKIKKTENECNWAAKVDQ